MVDRAPLAAMVGGAFSMGRGHDMGKDYATMTTAALQHRNCFLMGKLGRARRGKLQAPPEKLEAWRREFDEVTEELFRRVRKE